MIKNGCTEGDEFMAGYGLTEGRYENRTLSEDEMWSAFSNLFSSQSKNSSSYKFGFLKSIMDNLYNVDANLTLSFDRLFGTFAEVYWNLVLKHGIRQQPVSERSKGTYLEQALNATVRGMQSCPMFPQRLRMWRGPAIPPSTMIWM